MMRLAAEGLLGQLQVMLILGSSRKANAAKLRALVIVVAVALLIVGSAAVVSLQFHGETTSPTTPTPAPTVNPSPTPTVNPSSSPTTSPTFVPTANQTLPSFIPLMVTSTSNPAEEGSEWNQTYDVFVAGGLSGIGSVTHTNDGGFLLGGGVSSLNSSINGPFLIRTDSAGYVLSTESFVNSGVMVAVSTSDGGYAFLMNNSVIKTDSSGIIQWNKTIAQGKALSLIQSSDGGYALLSSLDNGIFFVLAKTTSSGNLQWSRQYAATAYGEPTYLMQTGDGGYALLGSRQ